MLLTDGQMSVSQLEVLAVQHFGSATQLLQQVCEVPQEV